MSPVLTRVSSGQGFSSVATYKRSFIARSAGGAYQIARSLRFNTSDASYLSRTFASAGNRKTWTWSAWVKLAVLTGNVPLFGVAEAGNDSNYNLIRYTSGALRFSTWSTEYRITTAVYRDPSAWYHVVVALDTTNATADDRIKIYINGVRETSFSTSNTITQNTDFLINSGSIRHAIGANIAESKYFDGYLADIHFIDGQSLTPSSFGETSTITGQWVPKQYSGTYGTNGFKLNFSDNSGATATTLGKDSSGNSNNFTPNNIQVSIGTNYTSTGTLSSGAGNTGLFKEPLEGGAFYYSASNNGTATITFSPTITTSGTVRIRGVFGATSGQVGGTTNLVKVNGTDVTQKLKDANAFLSWQWIDVTSEAGAAISSLTTTSIPGVGAPGISAIEINGARVLDGDVTLIDSFVDTPTSYGTDTGAGAEVRGNYATLNALDKGSNITLSNGNLSATCSSSWNVVRGTIGVSSGKWYFEYTLNTSGYTELGIGTNAVSLTTYPGSSANAYIYYSPNGNKGNNNSFTSYGNSYTSGDTIGVAFDLDNSKIWFSKNGTWQSSGNPASGTNAAFTSITAGTYFPIIGQDNTGGSVAGYFNFGQRAFAYTAPSGFKALCDTNLPAPTIALPSSYFDTKLYTGNGSTQTISGLGFSPDFVWIKQRSGGAWHFLTDAVRGAGKVLNSNETNAEDSYSGGTTAFSAFTSDGFSIGQESNWLTNTSSATYAAWCWDAGSSTVTNGSGSITSSVRANASAGFSIITYSTGGTGSTLDTVGHGLNVAPVMLLLKNRDQGFGWLVARSDFSNPTQDYMILNSTDAKANAGTATWSFSSTTVGIRQSAACTVSGSKMVVYAFAPVAGYSAAISWTGNGSSEGPFIYCGFRPKLILWHGGDYATHWNMYDSVRDTYNVSNKFLGANLSIAEDTTVSAVDILSNGFKIRSSAAQGNQSGQTYIGFAWAESPFQYARAR